MLRNSPYLDRTPRSLADASRAIRNRRLRELYRRALNTRHPEDWEAYRDALAREAE